jgi:hypothetical protein
MPTTNTRLQMVCTFIDTLCKYTTLRYAKLEAEFLDATGRRLVAMAGRLVVEVGWRRCCLETPGSVLLFTEAHLVRRAVQWSPMKPESWSGWFPLKSLPTCSCRCLCSFGRFPHHPPLTLGDWQSGGETVNCSEAVCVALVADISEDAVAGVTVPAGLKVCSWDLVYGGTWTGVACWWYLPSRVNQLDVPVLHVQITSGSPIVRGVYPQLMFGCRWYALLFTCSVNTQFALREAPWCYWSAVGCDGRATCSWSQLTALLLGDCWECACSSLRLVSWDMLSSEAQSSRRVDLAGSH